MNNPLKWHGGKSYLAKRLIALMPPHIHYVEPFAGGLAVLLAKDPEGVSEVVNDLNDGLSNFWRTLQDGPSFEGFERIVNAVPFSQPEWRRSCNTYPPCDMYADVPRAIAFFIHCRQSRAGQFKCFATLSRNRTRRGMNEQASAWWSVVEGLPEVHERLKRVAVLNDNALDVIRREDGPNTLFYLDPPYLHETRVTTDAYECEMTDTEHEDLLNYIRNCKGRVMISGYPSEKYFDLLTGWNYEEFDIDCKGVAGSKRVECVWMNYRF